MVSDSVFYDTGCARILLASASRRREDLLGSLGIKFDIYYPEYEEKPPLAGESPSLYAARMARAKGEEAKARAPFFPCLIIAADTVVYLEGDILGKPKTAVSALAMLTALNGRDHQVFTAVHIICPDGQVFAFSEMTRVYFANWPLLALEAYLNCAAPLDKAGAYGIQDDGAFLIERIEGSYTNVLGLPLSRVTSILLAKGFIQPESDARF